jgi:hypothetical protein
MYRMLRALALSAILTVTLAVPAFAASSTSTTTATVTVNSVISMTGVPATYTFPAANPNTDTTGPTFDVAIASSETAFTLKASSTDFADGGVTIPAQNLLYYANGASVGTALAGVPVTIGHVSPLSVKMTLSVPSDARSGTYTATVTWTASN